MSSLNGTMLILPGIKGYFDGEHWPNGALHKEPAFKYAELRGYNPYLLNVSGEAYYGSPQHRAALAAIRGPSADFGGISALYGFSGGGYNIRHVIADLHREEKMQIKLVVVIGAPKQSASAFKGPWELVYYTNPDHMEGPFWVLGEYVSAS